MPEPEILNVAPEEAIAHFRAKGFHIGFDWQDTNALEHARSFTVSKVMQLEILADVREAVAAALTEGRTFAWFRDNLEPTLRNKGWWGRETLTDPLTGETRTVQLGSPWRLRTIFDTNLRMSYAHGRWQRIERVKARLPYLRYVAVLDGRTRPEHAAWHGAVLPVDHPWWKTHYPPNGYRCRCLVQQLSGASLERYGYELSPEPTLATRPWVNRRTGEIMEVPLGIDPGFDHNAGLVDLLAEARERFEGKLAGAPSGVARALRDDG